MTKCCRDNPSSVHRSHSEVAGRSVGKAGSQFNDSVDYLYGLQMFGIKFGLENSLRLTGILGNPANSFRTIHVAGTNGKGSTSAIIASVLKGNGFKTGLYTSPHLVSFTERISINGYLIPEHEVIRLTSYIRDVIANTGMKPTFFEFVTAMAFYYFASNGVEWAVIETGMGGRLDATNVILPEASVITNIGIEHVEFLGASIPEIASEKAGIIKPAVPVVTAVTQPEALKVINDRARDSGSDVHLYGRDFEGAIISMDETHIEFDYKGYKNYNGLSLPLAGKHQIYNASLALRVCEILMQKGVMINEAAIYSGLAGLNFEGRLERVSQTPPVILDGAHNPEAAKLLALTMKELFHGKKIITITGIMKDKDIAGILKPLVEISETIILTKPKGERAASPERLKECVENLQLSGNHKTVMITGSTAEALDLAKAIWKEGNIILVTGSFYTTGEAKEALGHKGVLSHLRE
ncbi:MAG: bifunctional folylpolyglutamate synthase/dihydrofolate synthase [Nitrospirae bacterium]|nr:bifunctional folylpolyglutamate synthase/dihydrofolate synthase [Nitrospirota bacterium]